MLSSPDWLNSDFVGTLGLVAGKCLRSSIHSDDGSVVLVVKLFETSKPMELTVNFDSDVCQYNSIPSSSLEIFQSRFM